MGDGQTNEIVLHVPRMYRVAYRLLGDADRAHDVAQEACVKAISMLREFNGRSSLASWLHRITVNCAIDAMRSRGRAAGVHEALRSQAAGRAGQSSPHELAERRELTDLAWDLLEKLPQECRDAFVLTQMDGYTYDEAAEIQGEARGTMASRVFRAKKMLLEQMNAHMNGRARS